MNLIQSQTPKPLTEDIIKQASQKSPIQYLITPSTSKQTQPNHNTLPCPSNSQLPTQISFSLFSLLTSLLLTSLSTPSTLPSHSAQHSPLPTTPTSYHRCNTRAVRTRSSDTSAACSACFCASWSSCGCRAIREDEDVASGIGRSLRYVRREAVSGKAVA